MEASTPELLIPKKASETLAIKIDVNVSAKVACEEALGQGLLRNRIKHIRFFALDRTRPIAHLQ